MSKKSKLLLILGTFFTIFLSGCKCSNAGVSVFEVILDTPINNEVINTLLFEWHGSDTCEPDTFDIYIKENKPYGYDSEHITVDGSDTSHTFPGGTLLPGTEYKWNMRAQNDYDPEVSGPYQGPTSPWESFYTGPVCGSGALGWAEIEVPLEYSGNPAFDNWITHDRLQDFQWSYDGGCLPEFYDYEFATDVAFTDIVLSGTTTDPYSMHLYETFPNCSSLFWRVRANHGGSVGFWSASSQFHWVREGTDCYQTHAVSDDFAWLHVRLAESLCDQTGYLAAWTQILNPGCMIDGTIIVADNSSVVDLDNFIVDLGAGPCPSTGLDQKTANNTEAKFGVLTPGTYCFSISRNQSIGWNNQIDLMDGIWTNPRTDDVVAEFTYDMPPGFHDQNIQFNWDSSDLTILTPEFEFTTECRICPDPIGPVAGFLFAEQPVPIYARDYDSNWKLSEVEGKACYALLPDALIDKALEKYDGFEWRSSDLEQFPPPPPCPEPDNPVSGPKSCSDYNTSGLCKYHVAEGCEWNNNTNVCEGP